MGVSLQFVTFDPAAVFKSLAGNQEATGSIYDAWGPPKACEREGWRSAGIALGFLLIYPVSVCHCVHWLHRNTSLCLLAPDSLLSMSHCTHQAWWLRTSLHWIQVHIHGVCLKTSTVFASASLVGAACTSTFGKRWNPCCVCSVLLHFHPCLSTVRLFGWHRCQQTDLCVITITLSTNKKKKNQL